MATIYVKTREGRVAFYNGKPIPHDKFIPVTETSSIQRLRHVWDDIEVRDAPAAKDQRKAAPYNPAPAKTGASTPVNAGPETATPKKEIN